MNESTNMALLIEMGFWVSSQWMSQVTTLKRKIRLLLNLYMFSLFSPHCCSASPTSVALKDRCQSLCLSLYVQQAHEYGFYFISTCLFSLRTLDSCRCSLEWLSIWEMAPVLIPFQILLKWASCLAYHTLGCLIISTDPRCVVPARTRTALSLIVSEYSDHTPC